MRGKPAPRYQGRITTWKDDQGFGFITPNGGGPTVFVHIKSFTAPGRPVANEIVTYDLASNDKGQARAENVAFVRAGAARRASPRPGRAAPLWAVAFLLFVGACVLAGKLPWLVLFLYLGLSAFTAVVYGLDKSAARAQRQRTPEATLHLLGLLGGWPGALVARRLFRHKSKKESFRSALWTSVAVNCGVLGLYLSPFWPGIWRLLAG
ncbi:DUF1294 domain-containing protein [Massilia yuzhufengensis]|uniref:Uncharacterized membrane protein YsdA, DUF1294 family n=1 Tax=Massilia yuzhufengensis TaxID=1164594 RepID=A0A1I1MN03_9BURK|nr:DUF1294 domain-containing protein [Massilia yuzhufengensis]SFC86884.1 Uncharacterized membrane protein YsdA, DUF1294 family [Massilia yuzhufengensis]